MYIESGQVFKWRQRKRKKSIVSIFNRYIVMVPLMLAGTAGLAFAGPTGGVITGGSGGIETSGSATNISQASPRLDINWQTFSTESHESINFTQPTAEAIALNRVIGGVPSELRGALNANGRIFILNDSGITFFGTSQVNVGALLATTATDVTSDGGSFSFSGTGYGTVLNSGSIHVSDGGFAVLAAPYVANTGFIKANLGSIELASANDFTVDFRGDGLIGFTVSKSTLDGIVEADKALGVDNSGTLSAGSGAIGISASAASSIVQSVVNLDGVVDASAFGVNADGGTILVASIGDISIGGEVSADGSGTGNGGSFISWADGTNIFEPGSTITARGGAASGDGGFIEVSGNKVIVRGDAIASAPNGAAGTFLIDPATTVTIENGACPTAPCDPNEIDAPTLYEEDIERISGTNGTNVNIESETSIVMKDLTNDGVLQGGYGDITMTAGGFFAYPDDHGTISFDNKENKIATTGGKITMTANDGAEGGSGSIDIGHLETLYNGADITLTAGKGGITTGNLCAGGTVGGGCGEARTNNPGDITLDTTGSIETGNVTIYAEDTDSASAYLTMTAGGDLTVGNISLTAIDPSWSNDNATAIATLTGGGNVEMGNASLIAEGERQVIAQLNVTATSGGITLVAAPPVSGVTGISVSAIAREGGADSAVADADMRLTASTDILINGGLKVKADATNTVDSAATANADLFVYTEEGNITLMNGVTVDADATLDSGDEANAHASAELDPGNNLFVTGDVDITANADNKSFEAIGGAWAEALLNATGHDVEITGDTLVMAWATSTAAGYGYGGYGFCEGPCEPSVWASADGWINAYNGVTITGDLEVCSVADDLSGYGDGAVAVSELTVIAASNGGNDDGPGDGLSITGNIDVTADSHISSATGNIEIYSAHTEAVADALLTGGTDVDITGDINVDANAVHEGYGRVGSSGSDAYFVVPLNGVGEGNAYSAAVMMAMAGVDGNSFLGLFEDIASGRIDPDTVDVTEYFDDGDLNITGDVKVTAKSDSAFMFAGAAALGFMGAGTDATILTDPITVLAEANTGSGYGVPYEPPYEPPYDIPPVSVGSKQIANGVTFGGAEAYSYLICEAGIAYGGEGGGDLYITGDISSTALAAGVDIYNSYWADAYTGLFAAGDITVEGADPLAYAPSGPGAAHARVQGKESDYDEVSMGEVSYYSAELDIWAGGDVSIEPKVTDDEHEVISSLEANRVKRIEPLGPGRDPLRIGLDGLVSWATGAGVTSPSRGFSLTPDIEGAIARGVDPTTVLPSPAAGGLGLSSGLDAYSVGGADYCDQVVNGYCLPADGKRRSE